MKNLLSAKSLPFLGILVLLLVNYLYFYPVLSGKILEQDDIMLGVAKGKEMRDYREATGEDPLWTNAMFSGMPTFQMGTTYPNNWLETLQAFLVVIGGKASSIYIIFLLMLGFYGLLLSQRVNPWMALAGAIAFGFSAFFIISFGAGHNAKVRAAAFIAPTLMGVLLVMRGRYGLGWALTALSVGLSINANHFQITYYQAIIIFLLLAVEAVFAIKEGAAKTFLTRAALLASAALVGIGPNVGNLWSTYAYTQETMRGGGSELTAAAESAGGLDFDYAMMWSYGKLETFNLIVPNLTGGGMAQSYEGTAIHDRYFNNIRSSIQQGGATKAQAEDQANQFLGQLFYWGDQSLVNGAYYLGASVFFLFVLGFLVADQRLRWWTGAVLIMAIAMAWGKNLEWFNRILFDALPLYKKFRVPSMALVMVLFMIPLVAFLGTKALMDPDRKAEMLKHLKRAGLITGGLFALFALLGPGLFSFEGGRDAALAQQGLDIDLLISDRKDLLRTSAFRSLFFAGLAFALCWAILKDKIKPILASGLMIALVVADLWSFDFQHVNARKFAKPADYAKAFAPSEADETILQDPDLFYRVYNTAAGLTSDSYTSYHHKSIGGYHGAKLLRYQELIDNHLSKGNQACFDMLNAKWFILEQGGRKMAQQNPGALGNAWTVDSIAWVDNADEEMAGLAGFNPAQTVLIDKRYANQVGFDQPRGSGMVKLTSYDPKKMEYTASIQGGQALVVFSEIFYEANPNDWQAYVNNEPVDHLRVNYLLRGLTLPEGQHAVRFEFVPKTYIMGEKLDLWFSILLFLSVGVAFFLDFRKKATAEA